MDTGNNYNHEIIDATQNAVLDAANVVADVIEKTSIEIVEHHGPFYMSAEFWVAMSFVLVVVVLLAPIGKIARKMLKKRSNLIAKRIEDATNLKMEAQKLLAEYERKYRNAKQEAQEILSKAEKEVNLLRKDSLSKLENSMKIKEQEAKLRIKAAQDRAVDDVANIVINKTTNLIKKVIVENIDDKTQNILIDDSIKKLINNKF